MASSEAFPKVFYRAGSTPGILYFPAVNSNPYQELLYGAIHKQFGLQVAGVSHASFSRAALDHYAASSKILHLHWMHVFVDPDNSSIFTEFYKDLIHARKLGYTLIWTVHNVVGHESKSQSYELRCYRKIAALCDGLVVHSKNAAAIVATAYKTKPSKIYVVEHGSYENVYPLHMSRSAARKKFSFKNDELVFLFFGAVRRYKGVDTLLDAYTKLARSHKNVRLLIAGDVQDDALGKKIQRSLRTNSSIVVATEYIAPREVSDYFLACDAVVLPFKKILTSGSALLALTFKKPIIAPNIPALTELVNEDVGLLYSDSLDEALETLATRFTKDGSLGFKESAFSSKLRELSWDNIIKTQFAPVLQLEPSKDWQNLATRFLFQDRFTNNTKTFVRKAKFVVRHPVKSGKFIKHRTTRKPE